MDDWRIAAGARDALRRRLRLRDRRRRAGRDRPRRAGVRRRRRRRSSAAPATARCCRSPTTPTRSCSTDAGRLRRRRVVGADPARPSRSVEADLSPSLDGRLTPIKPGRREAAEDDDRRAVEAPELAARPRCTCGTAPRSRRCRRRPTRTVSASWPPARSTTPDALVVGEPVAHGARHRRRAGRAPERPQPHRCERRGRRRARHHAARHRRRCRCCADAATAPGTAFIAVRPGRRRRSQRPRRRRRRGHRPPRGDHPVNAPLTGLLGSPTRCSTAASTPPSC